MDDPFAGQGPKATGQRLVGRAPASALLGGRVFRHWRATGRKTAWVS